MHKSVTTPGRSHSFLASRRCGQVESMRPVVLATPVASAMPSAGAPAASASVRGLSKPIRPPVTSAPAVFTCTTSRCWQDQCMDVQPNDPAPQQETPTRVVDRVTEHTIRFETWVGYNSTWKYFKVRASCHVPCCSTPALLCSRTHRTVPVQMWMNETKSSFEPAKAKIDGRDISYPSVSPRRQG